MPGLEYVARGGFIPGTAFYVGGVRGDTRMEDASPNQRLYAYEPRRNDRTQLADMPQSMAASTGIESARCWFGFESVGEGLDAVLIAYGGGNHGMRSDASRVDPGTAKPESGFSNLVTNQVHVYFPNDDVWESGGASLPTARFRFAHTAITTGGSRFIFAFGGADADSILSDCRVGIVTGDTPTITWQPVNSPQVAAADLPMWGHTAVAIGTDIYLFGGVEDDSGSEVQEGRVFKGEFNTGTQQISWSEVDIGTGTGRAAMRHYGMAAAVVGGKVYLYGGRKSGGHTGGAHQNKVLVFDPAEATAADRVQDMGPITWTTGVNRSGFGISGAVGLGLTDNDSEKAHYFGGRSIGRTIYNSHHIYEVENPPEHSQSWTTGAPNPIRLLGHAGCRAGT